MYCIKRRHANPVFLFCCCKLEIIRSLGFYPLLSTLLQCIFCLRKHIELYFVLDAMLLISKTEFNWLFLWSDHSSLFQLFHL